MKNKSKARANIAYYIKLVVELTCYFGVYYAVSSFIEGTTDISKWDLLDFKVTRLIHLCITFALIFTAHCVAIKTYKKAITIAPNRNKK